MRNALYPTEQKKDYYKKSCDCPISCGKTPNLKNDVFYIGKESNYIDETEVIGLDDENYVEYDDKVMARIMDRITGITLGEARRLKIPKRTILDLKRKVRDSKKFRVNKDTRKKLLG